jgi:hypothetical protein
MPTWMTANSSPPTRATVFALAHRVAEPAGDGLEQRVADLVAERVVHGLEVVKVDIVHGQPFARRQARDRVGQALAQQHAIGQIRQRVVARHVGDLPLRPGALGDVLVGRYPAAARHGTAQHRDDATVPQFHDPERSPLGDRRQQVGDALIRIFDHRPLLPMDLQDVAQQGAGLHGFAGNAIHLVVTVIADQQPGRGVEHEQRLRHVVDGRIETQVLLAELVFALAQRGGALGHLAFEAAIELVELLAHDRDRAVGAAAVVVGLLVGVRNERDQRVEIGLAGRVAGLGDLSGDELVHAVNRRLRTWW